MKIESEILNPESTTIDTHVDPRFLKRLLTGITGAAVLLAGMVGSIMIGAVDISILDILRVFSGDSSGSNYHIIWNIRLPRIIVGAMVGADTLGRRF